MQFSKTRRPHTPFVGLAERGWFVKKNGGACWLSWDFPFCSWSYRSLFNKRPDCSEYHAKANYRHLSMLQYLAKAPLTLEKLLRD
jgi:hypothetical protein